MPENVGNILRRHFQSGDYTAAFETIYQNAEEGGVIPWDTPQPAPHLVEWADRENLQGDGQPALVIGCGTGADAEFLAQRGFAVTAFDIAPTAIKMCQDRFPASAVNYQTADLLAAPSEWREQFAFVLESRTLQALPWQMCQPAIEAIASCVRPGGTLLVLCLGRDPQEDKRGIPWALSREELAHFFTCGLTEIEFEDLRHAVPRTLRFACAR